MLTLNAAVPIVDDGGSALGTGVPCFDGGSHQNVQGTLTPSPFGNGGQRLTINPSFTWENGAITPGHLPLAFTLQANTGTRVVVGSAAG